MDRWIKWTNKLWREDKILEVEFHVYFTYFFFF